MFLFRKKSEILKPKYENFFKVTFWTQYWILNYYYITLIIFDNLHIKIFPCIINEHWKDILSLKNLWFLQLTRNVYKHFDCFPAETELPLYSRLTEWLLSLLLIQRYIWEKALEANYCCSLLLYWVTPKVNGLSQTYSLIFLEVRTPNLTAQV